MKFKRDKYENIDNNKTIPVFPFIITIDGNTKTGKTRLSKYLEKELNFKHLDFASVSSCTTLFLLITCDIQFFKSTLSNFTPDVIDTQRIVDIKKKYNNFQTTNKSKYKSFPEEALNFKPTRSLKKYFSDLKFLIKKASLGKITEYVKISFIENDWFINDFKVTEYINELVIKKTTIWFLNCKNFKKLLEFFEEDLINLLDFCPYGIQNCINNNMLHYRIQGIVSEGYEMSLYSLKSAAVKIFIKCSNPNLLKNRFQMESNLPDKYIEESVDSCIHLYKKLEENILKVKNIYSIESEKIDQGLCEDIVILIKESMKDLNYL